MNIIEAFKSGGKKIRRKIWTEDIYMFSSQSSMFHAEDILADDWELYDNRLNRKKSDLKFYLNYLDNEIKDNLKK